MFTDPQGRFLLVASVFGYLLFVTLGVFGVREFVYLWPYPLMLAVQTWVDPGRLSSFVVSVALGLALVIVWATLLFRLVKTSWWSKHVVQVAAHMTSLAPFLIVSRVFFPQSFYAFVVKVILATVVMAWVLFAVLRPHLRPIRVLGTGGLVASLTSWYWALALIEGLAIGTAYSLGYTVGE